MDPEQNNNSKSFRGFLKSKPRLAVALAIASVLILLGGLAYIISNLNQPDPQETSQQSVAQITITKDGFIPATLAVKKGTRIIWTNTDSKMHQIQANPHPTGESLPGLKSEILNNTQTYEYTADTVGIYGYHDQLNPTTNGTLDVQE